MYFIIHGSVIIHIFHISSIKIFYLICKTLITNYYFNGFPPLKSLLESLECTFNVSQTEMDPGKIPPVEGSTAGC